MKPIFLILLILLCSGTLFGQEECKVSKTPKVGYSIINIDVSTVEGRRVLFLFIGLGKKDFTDQKLSEIAFRLKSIYCKENELNVVMLDRSDKREFDDLNPPPNFPPTTRALYYLVRDKNQEQLQHYKDGKSAGDIKMVSK